VVLVDCVTIWLSNLLLGAEHDPAAAPDAEEAATRAGAAVDALLRAHHAGTASTLLVSNEVGMGLVPPYPLGRLYRDLLGQVNARLAAEADRVVLMVAGLPLPIKPTRVT
jgi:adenosylcobinamide kinase/adenosylcobinamide-phosphate guanylyltransferase